MTSRRSFLLGIGALVSASFVTRVKAHVLESARPLLWNRSERRRRFTSMINQAGTTTGSGGCRSGRTTFTSHRLPRHGGSTCGPSDIPSRRRKTTTVSIARGHSNPRRSTSISMAMAGPATGSITRARRQGCHPPQGAEARLRPARAGRQGGANGLHRLGRSPWKLREVGGPRGRPHRVHPSGAAHRARSAHQACRRFDDLEPLGEPVTQKVTPWRQFTAAWRAAKEGHLDDLWPKKG
jgi:hypothetical protein